MVRNRHAVPEGGCGTSALGRTRLPHRFAGAVDESGRARLFRSLLQGQRAGCVPSEEMRDNGTVLGIRSNGLLAVRPNDVEIAKWRVGGPYALFGFLLHASDRLSM